MSEQNDQAPPSRRAIREQIDENLRRAYAATLNEELPDRFKELLSRLKAATPDAKDRDA